MLSTITQGSSKSDDTEGIARCFYQHLSQTIEGALPKFPTLITIRKYIIQEGPIQFGGPTSTTIREFKKRFTYLLESVQARVDHDLTLCPLGPTNQ